MSTLSRTPLMIAVCSLLQAGSGWAETPHQTYQRFHNPPPAQQSGSVVYVQPSYPFTRHYIQPGQDPRFLHHGSHGNLTNRAPRQQFHHPHPYHHGSSYNRQPYYQDHAPEYRPEHRARLVQNGTRLSLLDHNERVIRQVYLRPGASWERQFGHVIVSSSNRLEVYDAQLNRISGMHLPVGATFSFRRHGIVVNTRFYTEVYDYRLNRLDRYRS